MRFLLLYISLLFLSSCYQAESTVTDSLIYCSDKYPASLNPQISHDIASLDATTHQLYNRLIKIDPISQKFISDIATHWETNKEKTQYTFFLRKDVNFHQTRYFTPTRQLNANDVIFSFQRMLSVKNPFHYINGDSDNYFYNHPFSNLVADIVKVDDHTITFLLNKPDATLLANLAAHYSVIHSQEYALQLLQAGHPEEIDYLPIGTGPYQFKQKNKQIIRYQAHHSPWQTPVAINNLIFDITPNDTKRYAKLISGECDIITNPASSQINQISKNPKVLLSGQQTGNVSLLSFNTQNYPFNLPAIRHALSESVDLNTIINAVFFETALTTNNLLPKYSWAYNPRTPKTTFSPRLAQHKLKTIGFDFNKKIRIMAPIKNSTFNPNFYKTAELIQSNWASIGIKSEIILLRENELRTALLAGQYDVYLTGNSPYIKDPDNLFRPLLSCNANAFEGNSSYWCDEKMQYLLDNTLIESNFSHRIKNYYMIQNIIQTERIYLPIAHLLRFDAFNKNISGLLVAPLTGINFRFVKKSLFINNVEVN